MPTTSGDLKSDLDDPSKSDKKAKLDSRGVAIVCRGECRMDSPLTKKADPDSFFSSTSAW